MLIRTLRQSGLPITSVEQASNGQEALEALGRHEIDLAVVDLNLPGMDGEELLSRIREVDGFANLAVVVISTEGAETRTARLTELGAALIRKPFTAEEVRAAALKVLGVGDA
jgi:DNA-binding response OmpR family regulator